MDPAVNYPCFVNLNLDESCPKRVYNPSLLGRLHMILVGVFNVQVTSLSRLH